MTESLRRSYRPEQVRLLLVGESPPASGRFFYRANSSLYRATREAFARVYERDWSTDSEFLEFFQSLGCYLDDLCLEPIDKHDDLDREEKRKLAVPSLAARIKSYDPERIASVMYEIHGHVCRAASLAGMERAVAASLPFPMGRNVHPYRDELEGLLRRLIDEGVLARRVDE